MPTDIPFGFGPPGGELPDPSDPRQFQQFLNQLQQMFTVPGGGPVNWDLARQVAQAYLTGTPGGPGGGGPVGRLPMGFAFPEDLTPGKAASAGRTPGTRTPGEVTAGEVTAGHRPEEPGMPGEPGPTGTERPSPPVGDPSIELSERAAVAEALRLADLWLESCSALPSGISSTVAWRRTEWVEATLDVWRRLCDPIAGHMVTAMTEIVPDEARAQIGALTSMVSSLGGVLFGGQLGTALGSLAAEVLSAGDIGLPLGPAGTAALLPANIREYGQGLEIPDDQVRLYVALREAAHQRLFGHVPWLRGHVFAAVETYAAGIHVDRDAVEEALGRLDPTTFGTEPQEISLEGIFTPEDTPQQQAALARLETSLALVEGWVCHVVDRAAADRLPDVARLSETFRRRRAAGGPAEQTFAALVGLELRPRRLREATALWAALTEHRGTAGRDALWGHPDLLPDTEAFADPETFAKTQLDLGELDFDE